MKTGIPQPLSTRKSGFTLIEMIGVIAVMAILAATITPNALRIIDRAAVRSEAETLRALGDQAKLYLRTTATPITPQNWNGLNQLAIYSSISPVDLLYNRRQTKPANLAAAASTNPVVANQQNYITRVYVPDPVAANRRAMIFSSMRMGVALPASLLPTPAPTVSAANFATIWDAADGTVPAGNVLGAAWNASMIEYLVIERINYGPIYATDLRPVSITLNNNHSTVVGRYSVIRLDGGYRFNNLPVSVGQTGLSVPCFPGDRVDLYQPPSTTPDYSYVISATSVGRTFDLNNGAKWAPQP